MGRLQVQLLLQKWSRPGPLSRPDTSGKIVLKKWGLGEKGGKGVFFGGDKTWNCTAAMDRNLGDKSFGAIKNWAILSQGVQIFSKNNSGIRQYGVFQTIKKHIKGEMESNPELQKSIDELKQKAGTLAERTRATTQSLYQKVDAAREEAEAAARQVSAAVKEKVSAATDQVKGSVESLRSQTDEEKKTEDDSEKLKSEENFRSGQHSGATSGSFEEKNDSKKFEGGGGGGEGEGEAKNGFREEKNSNSGSEKTSNSGSEKTSNSGSESETSESVFEKAKNVFKSASNKVNDGWKVVRETRAVDAVKKGFTFVKEELSNTSSKPKPQRNYGEDSNIEPRSDVTSVVISAPKKKTGWEKRWEDLREKARQHPLFLRMKKIGQPVVSKSQEIAEDIRDRWETSDSAVVHRIQDMNESLFGETATAAATREIRKRDPTFSLTDFMQEVQEDVRPVLFAYLEGDLALLRKKCRREVVERCQAERRALESQGLVAVNKVLHITEIEVKETKLMQNEPIIIVGFQTQQVNWLQNRQGKIVEGGKDDILTVYYAWAMQQSSPEETMEGEIYEPKWKLREMQQMGVQALI